MKSKYRNVVDRIESRFISFWPNFVLQLLQNSGERLKNGAMNCGNYVGIAALNFANAVGKSVLSTFSLPMRMPMP